MTISETSQLHFAGDGKGYIKKGASDSFTCGTVSGCWELWQAWPHHAHTPLLCIVDVRNSEEGNGQFRQFLEELFAYCTERHYDVLAFAVFDFLVAKLIGKYGFERVPASTHLIRRCYSANSVLATQ